MRKGIALHCAKQARRHAESDVGFQLLQLIAVGGIGQLLISSISQRDYAVVQGVTLLIAAFVVAINLLTDLAYALLDPRVNL